LNSSAAVTYETRKWVPTFSRNDVSASVWERINSPYEASVPAEIADYELRLPAELGEWVTNAEQQVIRFDSEVGHIATPFASILLRSESASSSQIENLTSTARAIGEAELDERAEGNAPLVVSNARAMEAAIAAADSLDHETIIAMQRELLHRFDPGITGRYRDEQVWIGGSNYSPHGADFVAPHHDRVPAALDDFIVYSLRPSGTPLATIAIAHAQFETIHPFPDGNGRTGRALVQAAMRRSGLTRAVTVPISAGILAQRDQYFAALGAYRDGDAVPIIKVFADGALLAVANGRRLVGEIQAIEARWSDKLRDVRSDAAARKISTLALQHPVLNSGLVREQTGASAQSVYNGIAVLVERGILREATSKRRNRIWLAEDVLNALDAFAGRSLRRQLR
jgi:Fic family protein